MCKNNNIDIEWPVHVPVYRKCCCCNLKTGCILLAILQMIITLVVFIICVSPATDKWNVSFLVVMSLYFFLGLLLLYGILFKQNNFLIFYYMLNFIVTVVLLILSAVFLVVKPLDWVFVLFLCSILAFFLASYVRSYYMSLLPTVVPAEVDARRSGEDA